jgi:DNA-binding NtrC family response regulator
MLGAYPEAFRSDVVDLSDPISLGWSSRSGSATMKEKISAVLVHDQAAHIGDLARALENICAEIKTARTCQEALKEIKRPEPPHLLFTDVMLPDGTWEDLLSEVTKTSAPVGVIVAARLVNIPLYLDVLDRGAIDFMVAPFNRAEVAWVVERAAGDVLKRRGTQTGKVS